MQLCGVEALALVGWMGWMGWIKPPEEVHQGVGPLASALNGAAR